MIIAIDFDGTIAEHRFPDIGPEVPEAIKWMKEFQAAGAKLILWTMRSNSQKDGDVLSQAVGWCGERGVHFAGVNANPGQEKWSSSPKAYAQVYIDDAAFGCPMTESKHAGWRPYVDWSVVGPAVLEMIRSYKKAA